jgi:CDP-glycerol glycerophosphotransferase (TagB/SpsB family)
VKLKLRSHPFARMENLPGYKKYSDNIISSTSTLEDDLKDADIVVSTYSTVAEEAFLRGIPVIQWLTKGFNGSVFRDLNIVRKVSSADELGRALKSFIADPKPFYPTKDAQEAVLRNCFYKADGQASSRIADATAKILSSRAK